jgi:flagellum-specific ATP synthase
MHRLANVVANNELIARTGRVVGVRGQLIECDGPAAQIGERCRIDSVYSATCMEAEVVGFNRGVTLLMPLGSLEGVSLGERVTALGGTPQIPVCDAMLGRVMDAFGRPLDGHAALATSQCRRLRSRPPPVLMRRRVSTALETGVKVIDTMLTLAKGQRMGLFSGSGVGKSSLLGMIARGTRADVNVVALIGERSREVREFVEDQLGQEGLARSVVIVATADESAVVRCNAAYAATAIAEYFRDQQRDVLLMMDSLTRFAMARREIGLSVGEPPTARGYTPSVFSELPQLCERSGPGSGSGSITGLYTVLVEGDDLSEPLSDTLRATLDGHIVMSRELANSEQYPAVDILQSISRLHHSVAGSQEIQLARRLRSVCSLYERNRQLIEIGAYKSGVSLALDRAVSLMPAVRSFFSQALGQAVPRAQSLLQLKKLIASMDADDAPH